jgi:hypothetical protein
MTAFHFEHHDNYVERDRPLGFHWRTPEVVRLLGLPPANNAYQAARGAILAEAILGWECGQRVSYSRSHDFYSTGKRYRGTGFTYASVMWAVADLARAGLITDYRVPRGNLGWQSSFEATPALIDAYHSAICRLIYTAGETLWLKDSAGNLVDYRETSNTRRLRKALGAINENLASLQIVVPSAEWSGRHLKIGESYVLPTPGNGLRRIFSRGNWSLHGRAYGWWQSIPKTARTSMTINGEPVAEADYGSLHASILYNQAGIRFSGDDAYDIDGFNRTDVKLGFNIAINAKNHRAAVSALADHLGTDRRHAANVIAAIQHRHKPIEQQFCSDAGVRLMRTDSELILTALKIVNDAGDPALPVHDALIVPTRCADQAAATMHDCFERIVGRVSRCAVKINGQNVPHMGEALLPSSSLPSPPI